MPSLLHRSAAAGVVLAVYLLPGVTANEWVLSELDPDATDEREPKEFVSVGELTEGSPVYKDRDYAFVDVGGFSSECQFLLGYNDDKSLEHPETLHSFNTNQPVDVFLEMYSNQEIEGFKYWGDSWMRTDDIKHATWIGFNGRRVGDNGKTVLYTKSFPAGSVTLMGSSSEDSNGGGTYLTYVCPAGVIEDEEENPEWAMTDLLSRSPAEILSVSEMEVGDLVFKDRDYDFVTLGGFGPECKYIYGSNDDKNVLSTDVLYSFQTNRPVTVFLEFYGEQEKFGFKQWGHGWTHTHDVAPTVWNGYLGAVRGVDSKSTVYKKKFPSGTIVMRGSASADSSGGGMYLTFVCPAPEEEETEAGTSPVGGCKCGVPMSTKAKSVVDSTQLLESESPCDCEFYCGSFSKATGWTYDASKKTCTCFKDTKVKSTYKAKTKAKGYTGFF